MSIADKKVVVIGSGIGGAGCAALLARKGFEVEVFERNSYPGGKGASFEKDGFVYDTGVHAIGNGEKGPLGKINALVGGDLEWSLVRGGNRISLGDRVAFFPLEYASDESIWDIVRDIGVLPGNEEDCFLCFKELATLKPASEMEVLDSMPLKDYVDRFTDDPRFHQMVNATCGMLLVVTYFTGSAGEFIYCFSTMAENASLSYPKGGVGSVAKAYLGALEEMGGTVHYGRPVEDIIVENGRVVGVEAGELVSADIVVSNAGLQRSVKMVERFLDKGYVEKVMSLKSSYGAASVKYALDSEVVEYPLTLWMPDLEDPQAAEKYVGVFYPVPSIPDPELVPVGCQLVLAGAVLLADPRHEELNRKVLDKIELTMEMLHPGIDSHALWKIRTGTDYVAEISGRKLGEVIGLAQDYRQVGRNRPDPRLPLEGLYVVGADAGGRGIGTEMAGDSALNVSQMIESDCLED